MKKIILASSSPRRRRLMKMLGIPFKVVVSDFDEDSVKIKDPNKLVEILSLKKAKKVAEKHKKSIIIAADTTVVLDGTILGKPKNRTDAKKMLTKLSGTRHYIITGFTVMESDSGKSVTASIKSYVKLKKLTNLEIDAYVKTGEPMDKAGAYAVNELGGLFVEEIQGDYFSIVGLPIKQLRIELNKLGIKTIV